MWGDQQARKDTNDDALEASWLGHHGMGIMAWASWQVGGGAGSGAAERVQGSVSVPPRWCLHISCTAAERTDAYVGSVPPHVTCPIHTCLSTCAPPAWIPFRAAAPSLSPLCSPADGRCRTSWSCDSAFSSHAFTTAHHARCRRGRAGQGRAGQGRAGQGRAAKRNAVK